MPPAFSPPKAPCSGLAPSHGTPHARSASSAPDLPFPPCHPIAQCLCRTHLFAPHRILIYGVKAIRNTARRRRLTRQLSKLNLPPTISSLRSLPPFNPLPRAIGETNKTGLGSSAALVTSLTAGLLQHLGVVRLGATSAATTATAAASESPAGVKGETAHNVNGTYEADTNTDTDTIHALAQLAHCTAQGKVGSGFDVSSAVYGSHVYKRFDPACIAGLMEVDHLPIRPLPLLASQSSTLPSPSPFARLTAARSLDQSLARKAWDHQALPFRLPPGLRLVLADVDAGTDTPSFVGKVLKFGRDNPGEKERLYGDVERANGGVRGAVEGLERVSEGEGYEAALEAWVGGQGEREGAGVQGGVVKEALDTLAKQLEVCDFYCQYLGVACGNGLFNDPYAIGEATLAYWSRLYRHYSAGVRDRQPRPRPCPGQTLARDMYKADQPVCPFGAPSTRRCSRCADRACRADSAFGC